MIRRCVLKETSKVNDRVIVPFHDLLNYWQQTIRYPNYLPVAILEYINRGGPAAGS